jgi:ATP-binding protein involved in chromosome partitioning
MEKLIDNITDVLKTIKYPGFSRDIISFGIVNKISVDPDNNLTITIVLTTSSEDNKKNIQDSIINKISDNFSFKNIKVDFNDKIVKPNSDSDLQHNNLSDINKIIAISSCKGGVGKSTIALNVACELSKNYNVGLLDLDIYGPSLPTLINHKEQPLIDNDIISPVEKFGIKFMSFGFINNENSPTIWRGPMVSRMTQQFFDNVNWGKLDYLILDLPPGTGDIQLTLVQKIKLFGAIIVTTPQDLSNVDVRKGSDMFQKVNTPIIGVVENMAGTILSGKIDNINMQNNLSLNIDNQKVSLNDDGTFSFLYNVFKGDSGSSESERLGLPLLAQIPLDKNLSKSCDLGTPYIINNTNNTIHSEFIKIVKAL